MRVDRGVERQDVAHPHRLLEDELVHRHSHLAARGCNGPAAPRRPGSTWAMTQPPKMSPLALQSAGIGITLSTSSLSVGNKTSGAWEGVGGGHNGVL
jgi:hypothetical protein